MCSERLAPAHVGDLLTPPAPALAPAQKLVPSFEGMDVVRGYDGGELQSLPGAPSACLCPCLFV